MSNVDIENYSALFIAIPIAAIYFIYFLRAERAFVAKMLRCLTLICLLVSLLNPKMYSDVSSRSQSSILGVVDYSGSMTQAAIDDCWKKIDESVEKVQTENETTVKLKEYAVSDKLYELRDYSMRSREVLERDTDFTYSTNLLENIRKLERENPGSSLFVCSDGNDQVRGGQHYEDNASRYASSAIPIYPDRRLLTAKKVYIEEVSLPYIVEHNTETAYSIVLKNRSTSRVQDMLEVYIGDTLVDKREFVLESGKVKSVQLKHIFSRTGYEKVKIALTSQNSPMAKWVYVEPIRKLLLVTEEGRSSTALRRILKDTRVPVKSIRPSDVSKVLGKEKPEAIIVNNIHSKDLARESQEKIAHYVASGGKLFLSGGDKSYGLGGYLNSPLDTLSPLGSVPPRKKIVSGASAVLLVIDKSNSMLQEGRMRAAKRAALSSIYSLKDSDYVGVIGFDYAPLVVIELGRVKEVRPQAELRLRNLEPDNATNLLPALSKARLSLSQIKAAKKHIIVLSDGQFPTPSDAFVDELNRIQKEKITVSTVALGAQADAPFMKMLARSGRGSFYQTRDASVLPKLFVDDIKLALGEDTRKERLRYPVIELVSKPKLRLSKRFPMLLGFVETKLKKGATAYLQIKTREKKFPLFASWKKGEGIVSAFSSDLQSRWSRAWFASGDAPHFLLTVMKKILKLAPNAKIKNAFDVRSYMRAGKTHVNVFVYDNSIRNSIGNSVSARLKESKEELTFQEISKGHYGSVFQPSRSGDFLVDIPDLSSKHQFPEIRLHVPADSLGESQDGEINYSLMSHYFIGKIAEGALDVSVSKPQTEKRYTYLQPYFLFLGCILFLIEVLLRERFMRGRTTKT